MNEREEKEFEDAREKDQRLTWKSEKQLYRLGYMRGRGDGKDAEMRSAPYAKISEVSESAASVI
jgi:hypothetical protein